MWAVALGSRALEADSFQTTACWWLSFITLGGVVLNTLLGWWWADPVAAIGMTWFLIQEGHSVWRGEDCCDGSGGPRAQGRPPGCVGHLPGERRER